HHGFFTGQVNYVMLADAIKELYVVRMSDSFNTAYLYCKLFKKFSLIDKQLESILDIDKLSDES
ncbi:MAG: hypothetical protein LVQ95_02970, partial [Candidatus Micrarchaeales archaeon]|nr:hypothetical protein [Candidatus Micrarchaeales archaeon]